MSTSLDVAATPANGWALSTYDDHLGALVEALSEQLAALNTSTNDGGSALPVTGSSVLLQELDISEAVGVNDERTVSGRTSPAFSSVSSCFKKQKVDLHEIVTSISDDQTKVALSCKVHTSFDLFPCGCHDDVLSVHALCAATRWVVGWHAGVVRLERPEFGDGMISSGIALASTRVFSQGGHSYSHCSLAQLA